MDLSFKTNKLAELCSSHKALNKKFGKKVADGVMVKLAFLDAAPCLDDVPHVAPYFRHELQGDRKGQFAIDVAGRRDKNRMVFVPDHDPVPLKEDKGYDLKLITAIEIIDIGDYHDG